MRFFFNCAALALLCRELSSSISRVIHYFFGARGERKCASTLNFVVAVRAGAGNRGVLTLYIMTTGAAATAAAETALRNRLFSNSVDGEDVPENKQEVLR